MKKRIVSLIMIMIFLLSACGTQQEELSENNQVSGYNSETDDQPFWGGLKMAVATKYGYYFKIDDYVYLYDAERKKLAPLCGRVDCNHRGTNNCNAFFDGWFLDYIGYYKDNLYMVGREEGQQGLYLYQISVDGSKRTKLCELGLVDDEGGGLSFMAAVHRGYFYYSIVTSETSPTNRTAVAYRISLLDGKYKKEEIYHRTGLGAAIFGFWAYDKTVLFRSAVLDKSNHEYTNFECTYFNIMTDKVADKLVMKGDNENIDTLYVLQNNIYCCKEGKFFSKSMKDGSEKEIETSIFDGEFPVISYDFNCLYCLNYDTKTIKVYDTKAFSKKKEIEYGEEWYMLFGDENFLFAVDYNNMCIQVYDKKKNGPWESVSYEMWT